MKDFLKVSFNQHQKKKKLGREEKAAVVTFQLNG